MSLNRTTSRRRTISERLLAAQLLDASCPSTEQLLDAEQLHSERLLAEQLLDAEHFFTDDWHELWLRT